MPAAFAHCRKLRALAFLFPGAAWKHDYGDNAELYVTPEVKASIEGMFQSSTHADSTSAADHIYHWWPTGLSWPVAWPRVAEG